MARLTDNDRHLGPITYARSDWNPLRFVWSSGGAECDDMGNTLNAYLFGWVIRIRLPNILRPFVLEHKKDGHHWFYEKFAREYGFSLHNGFLQIFLGAQTHDSRTTQSWSKFLPWTQWRHVRHSIYDLNGKHFWTEKKGGHIQELIDAQDRVPKASFWFDDYDGQRLRADTFIEEREWLFGEGWFKWLSLFRKPKVRRSLDLRFSDEVGPEKGSWKGGTIGHGIDMLPGEMHEAAFRRYCDQEHRSKYRTYRINFVGAVAPASEA